MEFNGRVLMLGCGSVAQCSLPLILKNVPSLAAHPERLTVMDFADNRSRIAAEMAKGVRYVQDRIERHNLAEKLGEYLGAGDILVDLAWNIDCCEILQWCHDHGVRYLNTSVELWDPYADAGSLDPRDRSLYVRHLAVRKMVASWSSRGPSAVLEHGANPGLVSHMVKEALTSIGQKVLTDPARQNPTERRAIESALTARAYDRLAQALDVKVIHIAERDTQITGRPKEVDEFVNTWSVEGLYEEGIAPAELGWGTHERRLPVGAYMHQSGPANQIAIARMGIDTTVRSWTPSGEIVGFVVRHGEAFTISDHLTVWDDDRATYRPTVHYAYCPSDVAIASIHELRSRHLVMQSRQRILNDDIISGRDDMGVLLMGHPYKSWWTGSCLSIGDARALVPHQSATTVQVGASVLAAVQWMIRNPEQGVNVPDDLPWEEVLRDAKPYLGDYRNAEVDWTPLDNRAEANLFGRFNNPQISGQDPDEMWQFTTFQVP